MSDIAVHCGIAIPAVLGSLWAVKEVLFIRSIRMTGHPSSPVTGKQLEAGATDLSKSLAMMKEISGHIAEGAQAFLVQEYKYLAIYMVAFSAFIFVMEEYVNKYKLGGASVLAFLIGALTSIACGFVGMKTAVFTNVRTAHECIKDLGSGFDVALRGGSVMGFVMVSLGVLSMWFTLFMLKGIVGEDTDEQKKHVYEALTGFGLGGSSIALFARVGGGIYTKAADVGADLSGKNEYGMNEDDPRNPACIADNVGDNVGDIAGMGADLFGSFAEATCAALVLASQHKNTLNDQAAMMYPLLLSSLGIIAGIATMLLLPVVCKVRNLVDVEKALKVVLILSTAIQLLLTVGISFWSFNADNLITVPWKALVCVVSGLVAGLIIGFSTEYYTSHSYKPVREVAETQKVSAATGIIYGLALGYLSCLIPVILLGIVIVVAHTLAEMYGVALAAIGMLGTLSMALTIDAYGPISDNAGGIAEMSELGPEVRTRTDALDAAGNTTAAIGKGFAIGSAALVALALFGAFIARCRPEGLRPGQVIQIDIQDKWVFSGLLYGAMMPFLFSAMTMKSVGQAATDMVNECMRQFPKIISGEMAPQYSRCIAISTDAAIREMILPGALVIVSPIVGGVIFGRNFVAGLLTGSLISGVMMAISMSNTGGAWDNAKKYIEAAGLKGSTAHKNAVTGDTVGDPLKDTSGPSLNILVKLSAIISVVFAGTIAQRSNIDGGPKW